MRAAARLAAYGFFRGKYFGEDALKRVKDSDIRNKAQSFSQTFSKEVRDGFKNINNEIQRKK